MEKHQFRKFSSIEEIRIDGTTGKNRKNSIEIKTFKNRIYQSIINLIIYINDNRISLCNIYNKSIY